MANSKVMKERDRQRKKLFFRNALPPYLPQAPNQCDQVWQNFATLVNFKSLWQFIQGYLVFGQNFEPTLAKYLMLFGTFTLL